MFYRRIWKLFLRIFFNNEALILPDTRRSRLTAVVVIAVPAIIQNLVQHLQMVIDRAFLGRLDPTYLTVLGNVFIPYGALELFLFASSTGLSVLIAQNLGAKKIDHARELGESSFIFSTLFSSTIFLFWQFAAGSVFALLGTNPAFIPGAETYIHIMSYSLLFAGLDMTSGSILSASGLTAPIMLTGLMKNLINVFLDWTLIYGNLGFPAMGLEGAALATVIANAIGSLTLLTIVLTNRNLPFRFTLRALLRPLWSRFWQAMKVGLPSGIESFLWFSGQLVLLRFLNEIDPQAAGVFNLVDGIFNLALFVYLGFARSAITLVGQYWGGNRKLEAKKAGMEAQAISLGISVTWGLVIFFFAKPLLGIFTTDQVLIGQGIGLMRIASFFVVFQSFNVVMGHAIRGTGDTLWMLYTQIFGTLFVVGVSYLMIFVWGQGLPGVMITMTLDEFLRGGINTVKFMLVKKTSDKENDDEKSRA